MGIWDGEFRQLRDDGRNLTKPRTGARRLSNWEKIGMDQFVWDFPAWVVCPGEGVG